MITHDLPKWWLVCEQRRQAIVQLSAFTENESHSRTNWRPALEGRFFNIDYFEHLHPCPITVSNWRHFWPNSWLENEFSI